jgi:hypothetical protein
MHQRRYCRPALGRCSSAAVACAVASAAVPATDRHVAGRGARGKTDEGDRRAPTRGSTLVVLPERSGGKNHRISGRPRAGGGLERGAALTGGARQRTPRRAAERRVGKTLPGTVAWLCGRDLAGFYWVSAETAHLFPCLGLHSKFVSLYCMSTWRDIAVNLLSNAIWAIGGYVVFLLPFLKKSFSPAPAILKKKQ